MDSIGSASPSDAYSNGSSVGCNLIDFSYGELGCSIHCDSPCFSDDYHISNLLSDSKIQRDRGFISAQFTKTPIDITISLPYPIDLERIGLLAKSGTGIIQSLSFYVSDSSFDEIDSNAKAMIENANNNNHGQSHDTRMIPNMLSVSNQWDISKERYPNQQMKKQSIASLGLTNSNLVYNKLVHQSYKFVGHFDDLHHSQDKLFTYFTHPHFIEGHINHQPPLNYLQPTQIKQFGSNVYLLNNIKSIRIRILKVFQSSCPSIGGIEIWGLPSSTCPQNTVGQIYQKSIALQSQKYSEQQPLFPIYPQQQQLQQQYQQPKTQQQFTLPISTSFSATQSPPSPPSIRSSVDSDMSDVSADFSSGHATDFDRFLEANPDIVLNEAGVPTIFLDPITLELMSDPVRLPSGKFVDRSTVQKLFDNHYFNDPFSGIRITSTETNLELHQQIQSYHDSRKRKRLIKSRPSHVAVVNTTTPQITTLQFSNLDINNPNPLFNIGNTHITHTHTHSHSHTNTHHHHQHQKPSTPRDSNGFPQFSNSNSNPNSNSNSLPSSLSSSLSNSASSSNSNSLSSSLSSFLSNSNPFSQNRQISISSDNVTARERGATFGGRGTEHPLLRLHSQSSLVELPIKKIKK